MCCQLDCQLGSFVFKCSAFGVSTSWGTLLQNRLILRLYILKDICRCQRARAGLVALVDCLRSHLDGRLHILPHHLLSSQEKARPWTSWYFAKKHQSLAKKNNDTLSRGYFCAKYWCPGQATAFWLQTTILELRALQMVSCIYVCLCFPIYQRYAKLRFYKACTLLKDLLP